MKDRVIRKIKSLSLRLGVLSFNKFKTIGHFSQINLQIFERHKTALKPYYDQYIKEVSRADMATSLELATFMYMICNINQYTRLLDMGSGLSSFIFRLYAKDHPGVKVYSIDDDAAWLDKTRDYLVQYDLNTENMLTLEDFMESQDVQFDCILHDLNFVEVRINYVEQVLKMLDSQGIVIFDDVHKPDYLYALLTTLKDNQVKAYDIKSITFDTYGRFALAALKG